MIAHLTREDIEEVAEQMNIHPAAVHAVAEIEGSGSGFLPDGRPKILFEAHVFYRLTGGKFGSTNVSTPRWNRSLYGPAGVHQWVRLLTAMRMDHIAAQKAASWGLFQILGENHKAAGYEDVEKFVVGMKTSEREHLDAFMSFCVANHLVRFLQGTPNFARFARGYNGPGYAANGYDTKLAAAYQRHYTGG